MLFGIARSNMWPTASMLQTYLCQNPVPPRDLSPCLQTVAAEMLTFRGGAVLWQPWPQSGLAVPIWLQRGISAVLQPLFQAVWEWKQQQNQGRGVHRGSAQGLSAIWHTWLAAGWPRLPLLALHTWLGTIPLSLGGMDGSHPFGSAAFTVLVIT